MCKHCCSSITLSLIVSPYWTFSWSSCLGNSINVFATQSHVSQRYSSLLLVIRPGLWTHQQHCQLSLIFYGFLSPLCDKSLPVWKWMPLKDVPVKQIHPYLNIYQAQNYHVPVSQLLPRSASSQALPFNGHVGMSTETAQHCRAFSISGRISSTLDSTAPLYICLAMSLLDIYFYRILRTQRTITNHIHPFMLNSLFCGLTFVYNRHTRASMVIFRFSILVYYLAISSNYSSFKYGRAPFFLPWFLVTPAFTTLPPPSIPVLLNQGTSCELICSI